MNQLEIHSLEETRAFAQAMAKALDGSCAILCLRGDLGAGKTTWTKALGKALGVKGTINSPTFTIMKSYNMADGRKLHHIDAYRLEGLDQDLGFDELMDEGVVVVEWSDFLQNALPDDVLMITIENEEDENRLVSLEARGENSTRILDACLQILQNGTPEKKEGSAA